MISLNLERTDLLSLASQRAPGIKFCLPRQHLIMNIPYPDLPRVLGIQTRSNRLTPPTTDSAQVGYDTNIRELFCSEDVCK